MKWLLPAAAAALLLVGCSNTSDRAADESGGSHYGQPRDEAPATHGTVASSRSRAASTPVPILMYHVISDPPSGAALPELYVRPSDFEDQMGWLARHGYTAITLRAAWDHWHGLGRMPAHPVVVTFDDGYRSIALRAKPVLARHHWPGVLDLDLSNLVPSWGLRPARVRDLIDAGWEVDSHTLTHPDLTSVSAEQLEHEVSGSRRAIQQRFHVPADFLCYPAGRYDDRVIAAAQAAGYLAATTTNYGLARPSHPFELARVRVNGSDGVQGFALKMTRLDTG